MTISSSTTTGRSHPVSNSVNNDSITSTGKQKKYHRSLVLTGTALFTAIFVIGTYHLPARRPFFVALLSTASRDHFFQHRMHALQETSTCRTLRTRSLTWPIPLSVARNMIEEMTNATTSTIAECPMFMRNYPQFIHDEYSDNHTSDHIPYPFWTPWQPNNTLERWSRNIPCQNPFACGGMFALDQNRKIAQLIYDHQHPPDCKAASFMVMPYEWHAGFGSAIHVKAGRLLVAIKLGLVLIDAPENRWQFTNTETCERASMECYFAPMTNCSLDADWRSRARVMDGYDILPPATDSSVTHDQALQHARPMSPTKLLGFKSRSDEWWLVHATAYLVRPNLRVLRATCFAWHCISGGLKQPERPFAAMFIRAGDKIGTEAFKHDPHEYFNPLWILSHHQMTEPIKSLYFGSDSAQILHSVLQDYSFDWNIKWMGHYRSINGSQWSVEQQIKFTPLMELRALVTLIEIYISASADVLIGTLSSNQCRLMNELRLVAGKWRMPYINPET